MASFFVRYRNLLVLLAILMAQIVGLAVQVRRVDNTGRSSFDPNDGPGVRLIRLWAEAMVSPFERGIHGSKLGVEYIWSDYFNLRDVRRQNQELQQTISRLQLEQAALLEDARQGQRLQAELGFQEKYIYSTVAAQAIGSSGSAQSHVFYIDKGTKEGLKPDMAVITPDGVVGKVRDVFPHTSQVLAVNDQSSGAGVILETTRIRGILRGNVDGQLMVVGILADERIKPGERVLTAGGDMIFPRGLPVGVVDKVVRDPERDAFIDVMVTPAAHLDRLDEVLVITATQPRFSDQEQKDIATSQEVMGDEAQAIKDQLKASQIMAEHLPGLLEPNVPADQQPLNDSTPPNPMTAPPQPLHPDRFTPGAAQPAGGSTQSEPAPGAQAKPGSSPAQQNGAAKGQDAPKASDTPKGPERNP